MCGQDGFVCHCCKEGDTTSLSGTFITECRTAPDGFNITHPPAVLGPIAAAMPKPAQTTLSCIIDSTFNETTIAPPLRPPDRLPFC
jgi:hypothetical protein